MIRNTTSVVLSLPYGRDLFAAYLTGGYKVISGGPTKVIIIEGEHHLGEHRMVIRSDERRNIATTANRIPGA